MSDNYVKSQQGDKLYPQSALDALRGEVRELTADRDSWREQAHDRVADWDAQIKLTREQAKRADAAERRVAELEAEASRLESALMEGAGISHSHRCRKCFWPYTPARNESEDCPKCGYDGTSPITKVTP